MKKSEIKEAKKKRTATSPFNGGPRGVSSERFGRLMDYFFNR
jgi:hypothetical protein